MGSLHHTAKRNSIPEGWRNLKLGSVFSLSSGNSKPENTISILTDENVIPVYGGNGVLGYTDKCQDVGEQLVIGRVGINCGNIYYINGPYWITDNALYAREWKTEVIIKYICYHLSYLDLGKLKSKTGQPLVSQKPIYDLPISLPPICEQKKVSQILSAWDRAIERVQRLIEARQRQKKGLMQVLLTGRLRFPEFGEPVYGEENIPCGWKAIEFHDCATRSKKKIDPVTNGFNFRCVELEHISQETGKIIGETESKQQTSSKNYFRPGNVLFGKLRPYLNKFAFCDFEGVCSSEIWVLQNKSICTSRYLFYLVQTDTFLSASSQTTGTKMPRSDWNVVKKTKFALPNLEEQERITALLDQVEQNIELLERYVMQLKQQKKGLMQKLLTGEIRVKVE